MVSGEWVSSSPPSSCPESAWRRLFWPWDRLGALERTGVEVDKTGPGTDGGTRGSKVDGIGIGGEDTRPKVFRIDFWI